MDVKEIQNKVKEARTTSKKRNFTQTFDMIVNLQAMDLKKPEHKVDLGITLGSNLKDKKLKICAIIDHSVENADKVFDKVIFNDDLEAMKGKMKEIRKVIHEFDRFVVQANYMPLFAQILGRYLGPMNKMPSPKLGMVITAKTPIKELYAKLQKTVQLQTKRNLVLQAPVGSESEKDEVVAENILVIYNALIHALPNHHNNVKNVGVKLTMGKVVEL